ncbi:MAG: hypothetical protein Q9218_000326 [Villophora microphyllina]
MFSYLRSNHRRSALPAASTPHAASVRHVHSLQGSTENLADHLTYRPTEQTKPSPISPNPPILPPIPRIASQHESQRTKDVDEQTVHMDSVRSGKSIGEHGALSTQDERSRTSKNAAMCPPPVPLQQNFQSQNRQLRPSSVLRDSVRSYSEPFTGDAATTTPDQGKHDAKPGHASAIPMVKLSSGQGPSAAQGRQGKTKLNLLNPMALLARRRSHQAVAEANSEKAQYKHVFPPVPGIPDDFDPRIRGKVVHDFSAPRPGSNKSSSRVRDSDRQREAILYHSRRPSPNPTTSSADEDSPSSGERDHTPQFKEHFDDDLDPLQDGPAKQGTSAFMYYASLNQSIPNPDRSVLPPFARHLPSTITTAPSTVPIPGSHPPKKSLEIVPESSVTDIVSTDKSLPSTSPASPPVKARSRASSNTDSPYQLAGLPKRIKSNASRFSFDMTGVGSAAQEQILEEKHRQNEKKRAHQRGDLQPSVFGMSRQDADDDDDDDYDGYDDLDEDIKFEERIPGINADEDELTNWDSRHHLEDIDPTSPHKSSFTSDPSLASTGITSPNTPREGSSQGAGLSASQAQPSPATKQTFHEVPHDLANGPDDPEHDFDNVAHTHPPTEHISSMDVSGSYLCRNDYDDMYFDDGMIDDLNEQDGHAFDESLFDDDSSRIYGLPLRDLKPLTVETDRANDESSAENAVEPTTNGQPYLGNMAAGSTKAFIDNGRANRTSFIPMADVSGHAAYHDALVAGVNQAALNGKFSRGASLDLGASNGLDSTTGAMLNTGLEIDSGVQHADGRQNGSNFENGDDFDFDDALADDIIIAAANAEALENDDEGFYGQEFGFFARASVTGEAEYANGGYFGSRGFDGIGRSHSGRVNEPSLTPITERSEWSNRNSAISLAKHGFQPYSAGPQQSPGIAQLADMMQFEEDDMSLSALMKLRRGAWGGSNASLHSSSSGSPLNYVPGAGFPAPIPMQHSNSSNGNVNFTNCSPLTMHSGHNFASSSYSLNSSNGLASSHEDNSPSPASATVTLSCQQQALPLLQSTQSAPAFLPHQQQQLQQSIPILAAPTMGLSQHPQRRSMSPVKRSSMGPPPRPTKGHSRNSSAASESVSYVLEAGGEEGGQGRWVLEKRRIDENGMVEVFGREVVEGGRI